MKTKDIFSNEAYKVIAHKIAKHLNIQPIEVPVLNYDEEDNSLWVGDYQLLDNGRIRYWGDEDKDSESMASYLQENASDFLEIVAVYTSGK